MKSCPSCESFVPAHICPECGHVFDKEKPGFLRKLVNVAASGAAVITLAACYGAPYDPIDPDAGAYCDDPSADLDGDGYCGIYDCDETSASTNAFAFDELGDGEDQNCDGVDGYADSDAGM